MVLTGCINMDEAYRAIEWRVIFLIAGMSAVSIGMVNTGLAGRIGVALVDLLDPYGGLVLIAGLFGLTMLATQIMGGQVSGLVMAPIAVSAGLQIGAHVDAIAVAVAIACSTAFLTPMAHPVNVLMMGPGGYTQSDFIKVGLVMTVLVFAVTLAGMVIFWGVT
jgi:di/tricarboxylate transporter